MQKVRFRNLQDKLKEKLQSLNSTTLDHIAKTTSFIQRKSSKISGSNFFRLMTIGYFGDATISLEGLLDILGSIGQKVDMTKQALQKRITNKKAVAFMKEVFAHTYKEHLTPIIDKIGLSIFLSFNKVFLQDSTQIELHEHLAEAFKGSGGSASKSSMKIDLIYELRQYVVEKLMISSGTIPDQKRAESILSVIEKGDLVIRDLGYFVIEVFRKISKKGAYYLSRYKHGVNVYLSDAESAEAVDLITLIQKKIQGSILDMAIFFRRPKTSLSDGSLPSSSRSCR